MWFMCCLVLAVFPQLPAVGRTPNPFLCAISPLLVAAMLFYLSYDPRFAVISRHLRLATGLHSFTALIIIYVSYYGSANQVRPLQTFVIAALAFRNK